MSKVKQRKFIGAAVLAASASLLGSCVGTEEANGPILSSILPPAAVREESQASRVPPDVAKSIGGVYEAPEIERRLSTVIDRLRRVSDRPNLRYNGTILNSASVNAFALPDGQVFVTRGLLALANDEAELAAVLAHEMAHIEANHTVERMAQANSALLASRVVMNVLGDKRAAQATLVSGALSLASFSRRQEMQADTIGIRMAASAGYDPYGAARFLENLDRATALEKLNGTPHGDKDSGDFLSTHPMGPQRVAAAMLSARQWGGRGIGEADRNSYLHLLDGMIYGDDPAQGLVRGQRFIHPYFRFAFTAPDGFTLENTSQAVLGLSPDERALRFDKLRDSEGSLENLLRSSAAHDLKIEKIEPLVVSGFKAATALGRSANWTFRIVLIRKDDQVYRFIFVSRKFSAATDALFLNSARSFHRLGEEDMAITHPYRLRVVAVKQGDRSENLASTMALGPRPLERFLILNGIDRDQVLPAGSNVKVIAAQ